MGASALAAGALGLTPFATPRSAASPLAAGQSATTLDPTDPPDAASLLQPDITARDAWGADLPVVGEIVPENDVRFLLVHHTASTNDYTPEQVTDEIRGFYRFHTGPEKGWPDVAYNFFIDRFGGIWEARAGSLEGPVRGDATGGSQGHALLCSLVGDFRQSAPTEAAVGSLVDLLAWLGHAYEIDTSPGATVEFVSRGSNRWPTGSTVTAATISGHRDMSDTTCPGEAVYSLLSETIPAAVTQLRTAAVEQAAALQASSKTTSTPTTTPPSTSPPTTTEEDRADDNSDDDGVDRDTIIAAAAVGTLAAGAALGGAALRRKAKETF